MKYSVYQDEPGRKVKEEGAMVMKYSLYDLTKLGSREAWL
jgi:hypothetical protein